MNWDLTGKVILLGLGMIYGLIQIAHTLCFPISEDDMRRIIREELKESRDKQTKRIKT